MPAAAVLFSFVAIVFVFLFLGCSTATHYRVMNFLFDGVPDPNAQAQNAGGSFIRRGNQGQTFFIHKPLVDGPCTQCHKSESTPLVSKASVSPVICRECHAKVDESYAFVHGPVASDQCVVCHSPHRSTEPHLLKVGGRNLCLQCHLSFDLSAKVAEHQDDRADCMTCHGAHGGMTPGLLKPAPPPSTRPVTARADCEPGREVVAQR